MKAISAIAAIFILLAASVQAQTTPEVVATGSDGKIATFVVTQNGVVKACRMYIGTTYSPECFVIPK